MNDIDKKIADSLIGLTTEDLQYMVKLVCLLRRCPGFSEALEQIIPTGGDGVSPEQLAATNDLMNKWLLEKGWADVLRSELESAGVLV